MAFKEPQLFALHSCQDQCNINFGKPGFGKGSTILDEYVIHCFFFTMKILSDLHLAEEKAPDTDQDHFFMCHLEHAAF